jgi:hypothetical protein
MTTTIKVEAHCDDGTRIKIVLTGRTDTPAVGFLENGEVGSYYIYGDEELVVREIPKTW